MERSENADICVLKAHEKLNYTFYKCLCEGFIFLLVEVILPSVYYFYVKK